MSDNPYAAAHWLFAEYQRKLALEDRSRTLRVPALEAVVAAYLSDGIDVFELEDLIGAAVFGQAVEVPRAVSRTASHSRVSGITDGPRVIKKRRLGEYRSRPATTLLQVMREVYPEK